MSSAESGHGAADPAGAELNRRLHDLWPRQTEDFALIGMDPKGVIVGLNAAATRVLGYEPSALLGRSLSLIFTAEDLALGLDHHELAVATRVGRAEDDRWHRCQDGTLIWISGVLKAIVGDDGSLLGFVKLMRDRTDLRAHIDSFDNRLSEAQRAAARRDEAIVMLGHELRNPINALKAAIEVAKTVGDKTLAMPLGVMERQVQAMSRMVDDLLQQKKLDHRVAPHLRFAEVDLQDAVRAVVSAHVSAAEARRQTVEVVMPDVAIRLEADSVRLAQVLDNLIDNAIKYTPVGGRIWVTATVEHRFAVLRVVDNGQGISAETLPRIFDLFTREARAESSGTDGFGIGLAVVKDLVQLHHGTIEVQSAGPGNGSEFTVNLPLRQPIGL